MNPDYERDIQNLQEKGWFLYSTGGNKGAILTFTVTTTVEVEPLFELLTRRWKTQVQKWNGRDSDELCDYYTVVTEHKETLIVLEGYEVLVRDDSKPYYIDNSGVIYESWWDAYRRCAEWHVSEKNHKEILWDYMQ